MSGFNLVVTVVLLWLALSGLLMVLAGMGKTKGAYVTSAVWSVTSFILLVVVFRE